jgi:hypothetical protein
MKLKHRSRYNLLPYFIDDEKSLATRQAYVKSCEKFFAGFKQQASNAKLFEQQAASVKSQAASLKLQATSNKLPDS